MRPTNYPTATLFVTFVLLGVAAAAAPARAQDTAVRVAKAPPAAADSFAVEQVNGRPLPARLREYRAGHTELVSGSLVLREDGTFTETGAVRLVASGLANTNTHTATGRYTVAGPEVRLTYDRGGRTVSGRVTGDSLTITAGEMTVLYRRR